MSILRRQHPHELQRLLDESEILAVMVRHMRAIDRIDFDLLRTCYHPDAWEDHQPIYVGDLEGFIAYHEVDLPRYVSMTHFIGNHEVEIDGDVAFAETLCLVGFRKAAEDGKPAYDTSGFVRYGTRLERRDREWRIASRIMVREPGRIDDVQISKPWNGQGIRDVSPRGLFRPSASPDSTPAASLGSFRRKLSPELQRLVDEGEIHALMVRYGRAIDRMDFDLLRTCYHPDGREDHIGYAGDIEGFIAYLEQILPQSVSMTHCVGNHEVEIDGDLAFAETLCIIGWRNPAKDGKPEHDVRGFSRYCDRLERRNGEWRIAHRVLVQEPGRIDDVKTQKPWNGQGIREVSPRDLLRPQAR